MTVGGGVEYGRRFSTLLGSFERMERAEAREVEWLKLEADVFQAFVDEQHVFLYASSQGAYDVDAARLTQKHLKALVSLRKRIEDQIALAQAKG
jgi:hypothetical protein